jgi:hypothetical protein
MMYIEPVEIKLGRRQALEEHNKEPHSRFSKHDALNGGATSRIPPSPGDINQTEVNEKSVDTSPHCLQGRERHPHASSLPEPTEDGHEFCPYSRTPPSQSTGLGQSSLLNTPSPMYHLAIWYSDIVHGREYMVHLPPPPETKLQP